MDNDGSFGFDPEDLERVLRGVSERLKDVFGQFGGRFEGFGHSPRATEPETTGETGDGVWMIYTVSDDGGAQVEQVYATELDALRANKHNTDSGRNVRFLPYGIPISVLDAPEESPDS